MSSPDDSVAFGAPGIEPRWTSSAKEGVGTAYHTSCRVWFTLSHGIVNEIYYPHVDKPNTRDFQFLISDGETFCHEEKRDLNHEIEYPERDCLFYRLTNSEPERPLSSGERCADGPASVGPARAHKTRGVRRIVTRASCACTLCWRRTWLALAPATPDRALKSVVTNCCTHSAKTFICLWHAAAVSPGARSVTSASAMVGRI